MNVDEIHALLPPAPISFVACSRIQQLNSVVVSKIAAGEVIERPASVVKELLENSVDAGSTRIEVDVEQGGSELIRIVDNGTGIHPDDLPLALSNHATSKLASAEDLFCVRTMGFRGEALASVGGIAQVTLQSRPSGHDVGAEIQCHGGELGPVKLWNGAPGTRIEVRHLFYNTPVRRKFLRAAATEMGHICEIITRLALSRPNLHLVLRHNNKLVYEIPGSTDLLGRIALFFGAEVRDQLYAVDAVHGNAHLYGYIADPACDRGNTKLQYLFLNSRWIRDRSLGHALQEGYRGLLMTGRYPVSFLYLELAPDEVDVNVHPTKAEVRFRDANALYSFILSTTRQRLAQENLVARLQAPTTPTVGFMTPIAEVRPNSLFSQTGFPSFVKNPPPPSTSPSPPPPTSDLGPTPTAESATPPPLPAMTDTEPTAPPMPSSIEVEPVKAVQIHNAYLVLETPDGMLVIDQHALHERVLYEQIKERIKAGTLESQQLLIPEPIDLSADQAARLLDCRAELADLGLGVEEFGRGTILVTRYPALLSRRTPTQILMRVVDHLMTKERVPTREQLLTDLMSLMACHAAVRAGDPLNDEQMAALVAMRHLAQDTHHCPHGRPTALLFTRQELDRQFRRI